MRERKRTSCAGVRVGIAVLASLCMLAAMKANAGWFGRSSKENSSHDNNGFLPEMADCYRQRVAVCVGINRYESHPKLNYAESDATEMAAIFREFGFDEVVLLTGKEATRERILNALDSVKKTVREDDLFVLYFGGHGMILRERGMKDSMGYLLPVDSRARHEGEDGIPMSIFGELTETMPSRHNLFLVDACYSGYSIGDSLPVGDGGNGFESGTPCAQIITAGGKLDRAFEGEDHALFTGHLLNGLNEVVRAGKGGISGRQLADLVAKRVAADTGGWQTPQFGIDGSGDIALVKKQSGLLDAVAMAE